MSEEQQQQQQNVEDVNNNATNATIDVDAAINVVTAEIAAIEVVAAELAAAEVAATEAVDTSSLGLQQPQNDLIDMVFTLEAEKQALVEESRRIISAQRKELEEAQNENEKLKRKVNQLEQSLKQSVMLGGVDAPKSRQEQEDLLLKAKTLLFEKTKVNKQQEQHIEQLKKQVDAIKDVVKVTKDMVALKTAECDHMQTRLDKSQIWIKAEKDKCDITERKLAISKALYDKLRSEHDLQTKIHKELREAYEQKITVLSKALETARQ